MRVYLIRHVHSVPDSPDLTDEARWITSKGREVAARVGARLREEGIAFDAVVTSPLVRAVQSAEIVAAAAGYGGEVVALEQLRPSGSVRLVADELPARGVEVAVVGHEPYLPALAAHLTGQPEVPSLRKGEVLLLEDGKPVWRLDPDRLAIG